MNREDRREFNRKFKTNYKLIDFSEAAYFLDMYRRGMVNPTTVNGSNNYTIEEVHKYKKIISQIEEYYNSKGV